MDLFLQFVAAKWYLFAALFFVAVMLMRHEGRKGGVAVSPSQLSRLVNQQDAVVLDIREHNEFRQGHIAGSINIPYAKINERIAELDKKKDVPVILVCKMGQTAGSVSKTLKEKGFEAVYKLGGGVMEWQGQNMPLVRS